MKARRRAIDWQAAAARLAAALPRERLDPAVVAWIEARPVDEPIGVGVSGGPDSLTALLLAWAHWPERRAAWHALHFNHRQRGRAADVDERFCREVAGALGIGWRAGAAMRRAGARRAGASEEALRALRLEWFAGALREIGAAGLVLGHQLDDVAETMLMRLARGAGTAGLAAPRPVAPHNGRVHLRPLLGVRRAEIEEALRGAEVPWRTDATNRSDRYLRNRLRRSVMPLWAAAVPGDLLAGIATSRALLEEDAVALEAWAERLLPDPAVDALPIRGWRRLPRAIVRRVLWRWLGARGQRPERPAFEALLAATVAGRPFRQSAGAAGQWVGDGKCLRREETPPPGRPFDLALPVPGRVTLPDGGQVQAVVVELDAGTRRRLFAGRFSMAETVFLDPAVAPGARMRVRNRRPGDRHVPFGSRHAVKLHDQFINRRIARDRRGALPVVVGEDGEILWVPGLPPAESGRLPARAVCAVQLTYHPPEPPSVSTSCPKTTNPSAGP